MGVLTASGKMDRDEPTSAPANQAPEPTESQESAPDAKPEFVPFARVEEKTGKTPGSRRYKAEEVVETRLKQFEDGWKQRESQFETQRNEDRQMISRLMGQIEALQRQPAPAPVVPQAPSQEEDPVYLRKKAKEYLDAGKFEEYEDHRHRAAVIEGEKRATEKFRKEIDDLKANLPKQQNPLVQNLMGKHDNVAMSGEMGERAVMLKDQELAMYGVPQGPDRLRRAFELADKFLASLKQPQPTNHGAAQALAAVPVARPTASGGGQNTEGYVPTPLERETAKNAGMSIEEYIKYKFPEKFINGRR